jgi:molecular chaperone GrpE (heat shock protein)
LSEQNEQNEQNEQYEQHEQNATIEVKTEPQLPPVYSLISKVELLEKQMNELSRLNIDYIVKNTELAENNKRLRRERDEAINAFNRYRERVIEKLSELSDVATTDTD